MAYIGSNAGYTYKAISNIGNNVVKATDGVLAGFFVTSGTGVTLTIYDDPVGQTGAVILALFAAPANGWYPIPAAFATGCNIVLGGTTPKVTALYQ